MNHDLLQSSLSVIVATSLLIKGTFCLSEDAESAVDDSLGPEAQSGVKA